MGWVSMTEDAIERMSSGINQLNNYNLETVSLRVLHEDFYAALMAGELAEYDAHDETRADFSRWKGIYETWKRRSEPTIG